MRGKIIKGIAGFYYVHTQDNRIYECKAKGIFRNHKIKPLVGDNVEIEVEGQPQGQGIITEILPRNNELIRPAVSNIDQAMIIFAAAEPAPNLNLLDRFLVMMQKQKVPTIICFNKSDIVSDDEMSKMAEMYRQSGYKVICTSTVLKNGIGEIQELLRGKTTVLAGPSGVGKSSIINIIQPEAKMETGQVSEKIKRGKHTTRHSELIFVEKDTYIMDTPGFSSLYINEIDKDELKDYFIEFHEYDNECRFIGCTHLNEPACAVKEAVKDNKIGRLRYNTYVELYEELKSQKRY
ncbi:MAG: ribosome small subunit-dependent GTPase A [Clostridiales bacterium]|nr:ribosome small subunit-dependent GTPase A [Clostridiales bacterium]